MTPTIARLRAELRGDAASVATPSPRLSWIVDSPKPGWRQASVELSDGSGCTAVDGDGSNLQPWPFAPLAAAETRQVQVRARSTAGDWTAWSAPLTVYGGFLGDHGWQAKAIGHPAPTSEAQPLLLRRHVILKQPIVHARLLWTALGAARAEINGRRIDDSVLSPGWTSYHDRLIHETTVVTHLLRPGANTVGLSLTGAWYTEAYGFMGQARRYYGDQPSALAQLEIDYVDGTKSVIVTDDQWEVTNQGPLISSGIYAGETWDLERSIPDWSIAAAGGDDADPTWVSAAVQHQVAVPQPVARTAEPVRVTAEVQVQEVITTPAGQLVVDFGQNLVGWVKLTVDGPAGHQITVRHAEVLDGSELAVAPLRYAAATDTVRLAGDVPQTWEPEATFHGFRYAQLDNWPGEFDPAQIRAVVVGSDMPRTGWFDSSNPELNRLHENAVWGMRGNFLTIPTDCPQRDERLGWTGDAQVFAPTAAFLYGVDGFLTSWLQNLSVDQQRLGGVVPLVSPDVLTGGPFPVSPIAAWGDAATVVPWVLYQRFGDAAVLAGQYPSMRAWVDRVLADTDADGLWADRGQLGDWLDPDAPPDQPGKTKTDSDIVATAYLARSLRIVSDTADILGCTHDADIYRAHADRVRSAFNRAYVTPMGRMMNDTATAYALALEFDLVTDPQLRASMATRLARIVRTNGYRISTGFVGTPILTSALAANGQPYAAERVLLETSTPSWLSTVRKGATTIWERWDSMLDDGTINPGEMTSFNHFAFGAVADWLHRSVAGLSPAAPGYRQLLIAPQPPRALDSASARHDTPYGPAEVGWSRQDNLITVTATVPANTTATVCLVGQPEFSATAGEHRWTYTEPTTALRPLGLDSPAGDILDDPASLSAVLDAVRGHDPALADHLQRHATWSSSKSLRMTLMNQPPAVHTAIETALTNLVSPTDLATNRN